ncbi:hypothetical protein ACOTZD_11895 [Enterobacter cloacae complex sp. SHL022]|uniref:hypothetical protein n=1 Tax=Enterobacter cloacae complex TaxID=354276 RepID=UPI0006517F28|nr:MULTISPECIES: hypothetical protein [Enterobacter cloacae complex]ELC6430806.1 hypothetical protein [Enterobacter hormaechei]KLW57054.1 hypothetical protein SK56_01661 [Enterobacter sp. MGH128]HCR1041785.1 hypothetical protein [Enterobacter hormaechei]
MKAKKIIKKLLSDLYAGTEYSCGIQSIKHSEELPVIFGMHRTDHDIITNYKIVGDELDVHQIHVLPREVTPDWDSPITSSVERKSFPITEDGLRQCSEYFSNLITMDLIELVKSIRGYDISLIHKPSFNIA